jgi:hypothetical protein
MRFRVGRRVGALTWKTGALGVVVVLGAVGVAGMVAGPGGPGPATPAPVSTTVVHGTAGGSFGVAKRAAANGPVALGAPLAAAAGGGSGAATAGSPAAGVPGISAGSAPDIPAPAPEPSVSGIGSGLLVGTKVVQTGSLSLSIHHGLLQQIVDRLDSVVTGAGGFVAHSDVTSGGGQPPSAYLTLRIPNSDFPSALAQIRRLGRITSLETSGQDVTSQYVDLKARIAALQATRAQYLTIMAKATSIGDILAVQNQLSDVQTQLEELQGQLSVLDDQTTYATLSVNVFEGAVPGPPRPRPATGLAHAWDLTTARFGSGIDWIVAALGPLALAALVALGLVGAGRYGTRVVRRRRRPEAVLPAA